MPEQEEVEEHGRAAEAHGAEREPGQDREHGLTATTRTDTISAGAQVAAEAADLPGLGEVADVHAGDRRRGAPDAVVRAAAPATTIVRIGNSANTAKALRIR